MMNAVDDLVIQALADSECALRERVAALEAECEALRALAISRGDDAATLKMLLLRTWEFVYEEWGHWDLKQHPNIDERNAP